MNSPGTYMSVQMDTGEIRLRAAHPVDGVEDTKHMSDAAGVAAAAAAAALAHSALADNDDGDTHVPDTLPIKAVQVTRTAVPVIARVAMDADVLQRVTWAGLFGLASKPTRLPLYVQWYRDRTDIEDDERIAARVLLDHLHTAEHKVSLLENRGNQFRALQDVLLLVSSVVSLVNMVFTPDSTVSRYLGIAIPVCNVLASYLNRRKGNQHLPQLIYAANKRADDLDLLATEYFARQKRFRGLDSSGRAQALHEALDASLRVFNELENFAKNASTTTDLDPSNTSSVHDRSAVGIPAAVGAGSIRKRPTASVTAGL